MTFELYVSSTEQQVEDLDIHAQDAFCVRHDAHLFAGSSGK